jgi:hypothetical protein
LFSNQLPATQSQVRLYPYLALASDHPTFATRPAHPLLPRDLKSVPAWGGPKGPKAYNAGHDFLKDPTNVSLARQYLELFEEGMGSSMWKGALDDLCQPWWPTMAMVLGERGYVLEGIHGIAPPNVANVSVVCAAGIQAIDASLSSTGQFNGFSTLENGQRYLIDAADNAWTSALTSEAQSLVQEEYFMRFAALNGASSYFVLATSDSGVHRWVATGQATLIATESLVEAGNDQVSYAWNRGAGKQYGVHIGSLVNERMGKFSASLSLIKRVLFTEVLYGALTAGIGGGDWGFNNSDQTVDAIGQLQKATHDFFKRLTNEEPSPAGLLRPPWAQEGRMLGGYVHLVPIAFVHDAGSGWTTPCTNPQPFRRLRNIPWSQNDYLLDGLLNLSFPGYVGGLWYRDQTRAMTRTPFGDMMDVLTDDTPSWLLQRYLYDLQHALIHSCTHALMHSYADTTCSSSQVVCDSTRWPLPRISPHPLQQGRMW